MKILRIIKRINEETGEVQAFTTPLHRIEAVECNYVQDKSSESTADNNSKTNENNRNLQVAVLLKSGAMFKTKLDAPTTFIIADLRTKEEPWETKSVEVFAREYSSQQYEEVKESTTRHSS